MKSTSLRTLLLCLGLLSLAACGKGKEQGQQQMPTPEVGVIRAQPQSTPLTKDLVGRVSAFRSADVRARVSGVLLKRVYQEGTDVKQGQVLFEIDPSVYQANLASAQGNLASAQATYENYHKAAERFRKLRPQGFVSQSDLDLAEANERSSSAAVQQAKAAVETARINLGFTRVTSPIDGRAGQQQVTEGALVGQNETTLLTQVDQIDKVYVNFSVSVSDLDAMRRAAANGAATLSPTDKATVRIQLPDGSDFGEQGVLDFSSATVNPQTGTVNLRAQLANPDLRLLPGQFVTVKATLGDLHNVFLIPQAAVLRDANDAYVMVVGEGHAKDPQTGKDTTVPSAAVRRPIKAERISGSNWVVTGGLKPGDQIIVQGLPKARENAPVKASPAQAAPASAASAPGAAAPAGQQ